MAIKLKKTVKKFSSTKPAWDELENCIKKNCSEPIKKLIEAGESQDKIKDTVNYLVDHIMEGDSESKEFSEENKLWYLCYLDKSTKELHCKFLGEDITKNEATRISEDFTNFGKPDWKLIGVKNRKAIRNMPNIEKVRWYSEKKEFNKLSPNERWQLEDEYLIDKECWDVKTYVGHNSDSPNQKKWNDNPMTYKDALELAKTVVKGKLTKGDDFRESEKRNPERLVKRNRKASTELLKEAREKGILPRP